VVCTFNNPQLVAHDSISIASLVISQREYVSVQNSLPAGRSRLGTRLNIFSSSIIKY